MLACLSSFLVEAKRATYAAQGDEASVAPALVGSKQLEYRAGRFEYCDIYFGMASFVGQERVALDGQVIWSMVYSGGLTLEAETKNGMFEIYSFLRQVLLLVPEECPYRGPASLNSGALQYDNEAFGSLEAFRGAECITQNGTLVYRLDYCGGAIR